MQSHAVIFVEPGELVTDTVTLKHPSTDNLVVESLWSGISTGTERLLWTGEMPIFPGMGYPLVPGYETVGTVVDASKANKHRIGERVFVPGSSAYQDVRGLFGGSASTVIVDQAKAIQVDENLKENATLMALAATAHHAVAAFDGGLPELIIGHGVLGRLIARITVAMGGKPTIWESDSARSGAHFGYDVVNTADYDGNPAFNDGKNYARIVDVSGDSQILDTLISALTPGGEIVLAGFYSKRIDFAFPPAFMKEARLRIAAEWKSEDLESVRVLLSEGRLSFDDLITHSEPVANAAAAYETAFGNADCLKMVLNWRELS